MIVHQKICRQLLEDNDGGDDDDDTVNCDNNDDDVHIMIMFVRVCVSRWICNNFSRF